MATLLIVEDDKQTNEAICEYLKSAGHKIVPAFDGLEALTIFEQENIDLVVLDIMLPKITGLGVLHELRKKSSVPIIMLTAIEDEYTQVTSFDEQADDYYYKTFFYGSAWQKGCCALTQKWEMRHIQHYGFR